MKVEDRTGRPTGPTGITTHFDRDREARRRYTLSADDRAAIARAFDDLGVTLDAFAPES